MRKLLPILLLTVLFMSCSSDDDNDPNNGNQNGKDMIDEKILGKWKVEYSKTIKGARFLDDGSLEIADNATVTEYDGKLTSEITSYMFNNLERAIGITSDNYIKTYWFSTSGGLTDANKDLYYKIDNGLLISIASTPNLNHSHKYRLENGKLTIERIPTSYNNYMYTISEYSKITE